MSNTRGILFASIVGIAVGMYLGANMKGTPMSRQIGSTGRRLMKRARGVMEDGVGSWIG